MSYCWERLTVLLALSVLVGCSASQSDYTGSLGTLKYALFANADYEPTRDELADSPYASQLVRVNGGPQGLTILSGVYPGVKGDSLRWTSTDGISFITRHGRILQIANWKELEIIAFRSLVADPLPKMHQQQFARFSYELDYRPGYRDGVRFSSALSRQGVDELDILGERRSLIHVVETVQSDTLGFEAVNHYWLEPHSGHVVKSLQFPLPQIPKGIEMTEAKPYWGSH